MKRDYPRLIIILIFSILTIVLLLVNALKECTGFWEVNISNGIEIFILIYVSYFLVEHQNKVDRKKEKISCVVSKIQEKIVDPNLIMVDTEENKKVTRIKLTTILSLLEIVKNDINDKNDINIIISDMDNLSSIVMDHLDDLDYIEKSNPQIVKLVTNIDTKMEQIKFKML